jgi:predicted dehydrogenase
MRVMVIGLGSMGKRRIRLVKQISDTIAICGVDSDESRRIECSKEFGILVFDSIAGAADSFNADCAIVSTSPLSHGSIINDCLKRGFHVFTELNLVANMYEENISLAKEKGTILFLSSTFLYRNEIQYITSQVKENTGRLNYRYHVGQYLPEWHPWESYKSYFVGNKLTNGCREIMAIELPWIIGMFGKIKSITVVHDKMTDLEIDYSDNYLIQLTHENGNKGSLCIDIVSRKAVRILEVYGQDLYITWDGTPDSLAQYDIKEKRSKPITLYEHVDKQSNYASYVVENAYQTELEAFFSAVQAGCNANYNMADDLETLRIADLIENSASNITIEL